MQAEQNEVAAWHRAMGVTAPNRPLIGSSNDVDLNYRLIQEELDEYHEAALNGDLIGVADALADVAYTLLRAAYKHGMELKPLFWAVAKSNWSKLDENGEPVPHPTIPGKIGKSDRYQDPTWDLAAELEAQGV